MRTLSDTLDAVLIDLAVRCPEITLEECPDELRAFIQSARAADLRERKAASAENRPSP